MKSINPATGEVIFEYNEIDSQEISQIIQLNFDAWSAWKMVSFKDRAIKMHKLAEVLRAKKEEYSKLITTEMGKRVAESEGEIEKCAWVCEYYADNAESMLADEIIESDGSKSMAVYQPLGPVLAVMPWNFPFWQVLRFAVPALMAGNSALLKHASNVQGCALAIESLFVEAGFPENLFRTLVVEPDMVEEIIANPRVTAVTLTGSEWAGSKVASAAGKYLKKSVLELGGSDPLIVCSDADLEEAASVGVISRMMTTGQTCISAKRFIVDEKVADEFIQLLRDKLIEYMPGNPLDRETSLAPMARPDLVMALKQQVDKSVVMGAKLECGGDIIQGNYFAPTLLTGVTNDMPVYKEETFGPVIAVIVVRDEEEAVRVANDTIFGLGASVWTNDNIKGKKMAREIDAGAVFVNGMVKSDPRLPFGGIKKSGYGRELSLHGIKEFVNIKSVWIK
jgi:succinate-semialdehyde dehydrogenase/glutarate-semialdehyde dehydrogenase